MIRIARLACLLLLAGPTLLHAQERVHVRRLSDLVAVREGIDGDERVLYYFEPTAELPAGGEIQQGAGGHTEVVLSAGGRISMYDAGHLVIITLADAGDVLQFKQLTESQVFAGNRPLELRLPGGTVCKLLDTNALVEIEPGRLRIRNGGGRPVIVEGALDAAQAQADDRAAGSMRLERGEEVIVPLFLSEVVVEGREASAWGARTVRYGAGVSLQADGRWLTVRGLGTPGLLAVPAVRVGGVRSIPGPEGLLIEDAWYAPAAAPPVTSDSAAEDRQP